MPVDTVWLETKAAVSGLDQLGIRATAIRMYAHLIPSITNVTDRARYFSLHPYAIDCWAREVGTDDPVAFRQFLRRLECLLAIGERVRVYGSEEESYGVVGRIKIGRWLNKQPDPRDHDYAVPLDRLQEEYFANSWGSLGQYYGGPEAELGIIAWDEGFPKLTPLGQQLAAAFRTGVQPSHLSAVLKMQKPRIADIRKIGSKVRFDCLTPAEIHLLRDIFLDLNNHYGETGLRRRKSCLLVLSIARQMAGAIEDVASTVVEAALHGRCEQNVPYVPPAPLADHLSLWKIYAFHELLALALEVLLATAVEVLQELEIAGALAPATASELADKCLDRLPPHISRKKINDLIEDSLRRFREPSLISSADPWEEESLRKAARGSFYDSDFAGALHSALKLIVRIVARLPQNPYLDFTNANMPIDKERLGLPDLQQFIVKHQNGTVLSALRELITTSVNLHLRVATAKLAYNNDFTYKLVYESGRLRKVQKVDPAFSRPRLQQTAQLLADIGLLARRDKAFRITPDGIALLQQFGC